jgi:hypothetical protein
LPRDDEKVRSFLLAGSEIASGAAGAAVGLLVGGPSGAILGGASGPALTRALRRLCVEVFSRVSGEREKVRGGAVVALAAVAIAKRLEAGEQPRDDGFFLGDHERSSAEVLLEGVILRARSEHEEKKVRLYGNLFANAVFDASISPPTISFLLAVAEQLTYRQLCLLHLYTLSSVSLAEVANEAKVEHNWPERSESEAIKAEIHDLYQRGLVRIHQEPDAYQDEWIHDARVNFDKGNPSIELTEVGERLVELLGAASIPHEELVRYRLELP